MDGHELYLHIEQIVDEGRSHETEDGQPDGGDEDETLMHRFQQELQVCHDDHVVNRHGSETSEIYRLWARCEYHRIVTPDGPTEEIDDQRVVKCQ